MTSSTIKFFYDSTLSKTVMTISSTGISVDPEMQVDDAAKAVLAALDGMVKVMVQKAVEAEREACAKVCIETGATKGRSDEGLDMADYCAAAIRARSRA